MSLISLNDMWTSGILIPEPIHNFAHAMASNCSSTFIKKLWQAMSCNSQLLVYDVIFLPKFNFIIRSPILCIMVIFSLQHSTLHNLTFSYYRIEHLTFTELNIQSVYRIEHSTFTESNIQGVYRI